MTFSKKSNSYTKKRSVNNLSRKIDRLSTQVNKTKPEKIYRQDEVDLSGSVLTPVMNYPVAVTLGKESFAEWCSFKLKLSCSVDDVPYIDKFRLVALWDKNPEDLSPIYAMNRYPDTDTQKEYGEHAPFLSTGFNQNKQDVYAIRNPNTWSRYDVLLDKVLTVTQDRPRVWYNSRIPIQRKTIEKLYKPGTSSNYIETGKLIIYLIPEEGNNADTYYASKLDTVYCYIDTN